MRILAVDVGSVRTGFAVSDPMGYTAQPLPTEQGGSAKHNAKIILQKIVEYENKSNNDKIKTVIIGNPIHLTGKESEMSSSVNECARLLKQYIKQNLNREIDIILRDERFTSVAADKFMLAADLSRKKRKEIKDRVAAQLILQNYLDTKKIENEK